MSITCVAYLRIWRHLTGTNIVRLHNKLAETVHFVPKVSWYVAITISCRFSCKNRYKFHQCLWIVVNHSERIMGLILIKVVLLFFSWFVYRHGNPNTDRIERSIYFKMTLTSHVPHTSRKKYALSTCEATEKCILRKIEATTRFDWCYDAGGHASIIFVFLHDFTQNNETEIVCLWMRDRLVVLCSMRNSASQNRCEINILLRCGKLSRTTTSVMASHFSRYIFFISFRSFFYRTFCLFFSVWITWISYYNVSPMRIIFCENVSMLSTSN